MRSICAGLAQDGGGSVYYTWNAAGQMSAAEPAAGVTSFTYDADGRSQGGGWLEWWLAVGLLCAWQRRPARRRMFVRVLVKLAASPFISLSYNSAVSWRMP